MKIESVNIALDRQFDTPKGIRTSGIVKRPVTGPVAIHKLGLEGDFIGNETVHGGLDQAVYLYSSEDNDWWAQTLERAIDPGTFGENLTLSGFDSRLCRVGDRLRIGEMLLEISAPRTPCATLAARMGDASFVKKFFQAQRPGAYARVIEEGEVTAGDAVEWLPTSGDYVKTLDVFTQWNLKNKSRTIMLKALDSPIASVHKGKLQKWVDATAS